MGVRVGLVVGLCLAFVTTVYADVDVMGEIRSGDDATLYGDWDRAVKHSTNAIGETESLPAGKRGSTLKILNVELTPFPPPLHLHILCFLTS